MALGKKEMKAVKCNTRKVLLTRNRGLTPPALFTTAASFPKIHFSSQYQSTGAKQLENVIQHRTVYPKTEVGIRWLRRNSPMLIIQSDQMQDQGLVPEQKWHIPVSLGPICLKLLSQALVSFSSMPTRHIYIHTSSHTLPWKGSQSYSCFNWFSTPGNWSGENFQAVVMSERWK